LVHSAAYNAGHILGTIAFISGILAIGLYFGNRLARKREDGIFVRWPVGVALAVILLGLLGQCSAPTRAAGASIASIFSSDDYPPEAFKNGWEGDVGVRVHIGTDGKPHSCRILHSSGYPVLDVQTCAIVLGRARFTPARDSSGNAVEDDFVVPTVRWAIDSSTRPHFAADLAPNEANWKLVGNGSAGQAFLDVNSVGQQGDYRIAWVKIVFAQAMPDGSAYRVGQYRYDCATKSSALLLGEAFRQDGAPILIVQYPEASQKTFPITPKSTMDGIFKRVCR